MDTRLRKSGVFRATRDTPSSAWLSQDREPPAPSERDGKEGVDPPRNVISRLAVAAQNFAFRLLGKEFRTFAHPPSAMLATLEQRGFRQTFGHSGVIWQLAGLEHR